MNGQNVAGINIANYEADKAAGLLTVGKIGDIRGISAKRFDPNTGKEVKAQFFNLDVLSLEEAKQNLLDQVAGIDKLIADLKALDEKGE